MLTGSKTTFKVRQMVPDVKVGGLEVPFSYPSLGLFLKEAVESV